MELIILWILALFGLWDLVSRIIENLYIDNRCGVVEVTLKLKNEEKIVEELVRELQRITLIGKIVVVDMDSNDKTLEILHKLKDKYPILQIEENSNSL